MFLESQWGLNSLDDCVFVSLGLIRCRFLGKVLSAERASKPIENGVKGSGAQPGNDSKTSSLRNANVTKPVDGDTKSGGLPIPEPIADKLGVDYPFPPHLEYAYNSHFAPISICCIIAIYRCISYKGFFSLVRLLV